MKRLPLLLSLIVSIALVLSSPAEARIAEERAVGIAADASAGRPDARAASTLFGSERPAGVRVSGGKEATVGVVLSSSTPGSITALRYYRARQSTGRPVGAVYSTSGERLAKVRFASTRRGGWKSARLSTPVDVTAGQSLSVAIHMPRGGFAIVKNYAWPRRSGPLTATRAVKKMGERLARPRGGSETHNYLVDVAFRGAAAAQTPAPTPTTSGWPDATNTGVVGCPPLQKVDNGDQIQLNQDGAVFENKELMNPANIKITARNVTVRCVKMHGTGYFGIDNEELPDNPAPGVGDTTIDRVDIDCENEPQVIGILAQSATVSRANVYNCDHFLNAGGDNLVIRDSYCHELTDLPVVHADCIQTLGGNNNMLIEHNSLWSRDTSDILLGQEFGDASNVVINNNRLMSIGTPPPAYLLYLSGTNTVVTNNRFTKRYTYGACTLNTKNPVVWSGNVWDETGRPYNSCG